VKAWRERPLAEEYYAVFLDGSLLSIRRGKTAKEPVYIALGIKPDGRREIPGCWPFGAEGESTHNWEEVLKDLKRRGVQRVRIFITDDLPGLAEAIKKIYRGERPRKPCGGCGSAGAESIPGSWPGGGQGLCPVGVLRHPKPIRRSSGPRTSWNA